MPKLSWRDRVKIREAYDDGLTQKELALIFGVTQGMISNVVNPKKVAKRQAKADMMEAFLGGALPTDGNTRSVPKNSGSHREYTPIPENQIDRSDPLSVLLAEELVEIKMGLYEKDED